MTIAERLADANARSVKLYLQRTAIESQVQSAQNQVQHLQMQGQAVMVELLKLDGEIVQLTSIQAEEAKAHG